MRLLEWFRKHERVDIEKVLLSRLVEIDSKLASIDKNMGELRDAAYASLKKYKCIICSSEFARLPGQSEKRCPACQREIKNVSAPSLSNSNGGHRGAGHDTRGIHKKVGQI